VLVEAAKIDPAGVTPTAFGSMTSGTALVAMTGSPSQVQTTYEPLVVGVQSCQTVSDGDFLSHAVPSTLPVSDFGSGAHGNPGEWTLATTWSGFEVLGHESLSPKYVESPTRGWIA
jgi:hypothetical protein